MYGLPDTVAGYYALKYYRKYKSAPRTSAAVLRSITRFEFGITKVVIYRPALKTYLNTPSGPLWYWMEKKGRKAVRAAKRQVGVDTGRLRKSISMAHYATASGQTVKIGSNLNYALMHHEGTRPHIITPNRAKALRFTSGRRVIYTHQVMHPGTRPNRYLSNQLRFFLLNL